MFLTSVSFCFLLLVCMGNRDRKTDRFWHGLIVAGNWMLYCDQMQIKTGEDASARLFPVFLFGVFVVTKRVLANAGIHHWCIDSKSPVRISNDNSRWFRDRGPTLCVVAWFLSALLNITAAYLEDRDLSFFMPSFHVWLFATAMAFYLTIIMIT
ncbi:unnamed protein product, partial [Amoebophrya sp. A25]|eukprot:GSA25T00020428001.1